MGRPYAGAAGWQQGRGVTTVLAVAWIAAFAAPIMRGVRIKFSMDTRVVLGGVDAERETDA